MPTLCPHAGHLPFSTSGTPNTHPPRPTFVLEENRPLVERWVADECSGFLKRMEEEIICNRWKDLADETGRRPCGGPPEPKVRPHVSSPVFPCLRQQRLHDFLDMEVKVSRAGAEVGHRRRVFFLLVSPVPTLPTPPRETFRRGLRRGDLHVTFGR